MTRGICSGAFRLLPLPSRRRRNHDNIAQPSWASRGHSCPWGIRRYWRPRCSLAAGALFYAENCNSWVRLNGGARAV